MRIILICADLLSEYHEQTKTAKSMVGLSLSVDTSQSLTVAEYIKRRGNSTILLQPLSQICIFWLPWLYTNSSF